MMAKNTGEGYRKGSVKDRSQIQNPKTGQWVKRDTETGEFIDVKEDGKPFKGVAKEVDDRKE
jgi:hypothetical protein